MNRAVPSVIFTSAPGKTQRGAMHDRSLTIRAATLFAAIALHVLLLILLLHLRDPTARIIVDDSLTVIDLPRVEPQVRSPPPPTAPRVVPVTKVAGGASPRPASQARPNERVDITSVPLEPPVPPLPVEVVVKPSVSSGTADSGYGVAVGGTGKAFGGDGRGWGTGAGDGIGSGSGAEFAAAAWAYKPSDDDLAPYNALIGQKERMQGQVRMRCQVTLRQRARNCRITSDTHRRLNLGVRALEATHMFRIFPPLQNGKPVDRAWVAVVIDFSN